MTEATRPKRKTFSEEAEDKDLFQTPLRDIYEAGAHYTQQTDVEKRICFVNCGLPGDQCACYLQMFAEQIKV